MRPPRNVVRRAAGVASAPTNRRFASSAASTASFVSSTRASNASALSSMAGIAPRAFGQTAGSKASALNNPRVNRILGNPGSKRRIAAYGTGTALGVNAVLGPKPPSSGRSGLNPHSSGGML